MKDFFVTKNFSQTKKIAANLGRKILKLKPKRKAIIIGLIGDLGSGKTVFSQGFAKGLGIKENIVSPTFVLEKIYELPKKYRHFIHIDAYRINKSKEIINFGFKNLVRDPKNVILIEWADRIKKILPRDCIKIKFEHIDKNKRKIWISRRIK
jgi:tRNA threonylcarbamoyladenosine biosynthesis protein TsaE